MHPAGQKHQELCQAQSKKWLLQSGTTKGSSAAERSGAPQMLHHQRLTSRGTTNGSSDAAKGLQEELGIKQTAPPVLPANHCSAGMAQSNLRSWRQDTILRRGGHQGGLQDGKNAKSFAKHKARNGSSRAAPQRDPLRPSAQGLLKCCTINGSPAWHHQRLPRCSKGAPRRAGHQTNCSSGAPS